jgi:hypothetical protein
MGNVHFPSANKRITSWSAASGCQLPFLLLTVLQTEIDVDAFENFSCEATEEA